MAVRNNAGTLAAQLEALAGQSFEQDWEVVLADNGSTDGSAGVAREWLGKLPMRITQASEKAGRGYALNRAVAEARGDFILTCDGDDVVNRDWLAAMTRAAPEFDLEGGALEFSMLNSPLILEWRPPPERNELQLGLKWLPCARGANFGMWKAVFEDLGGFDEGYSLGQDWELCFRAQVAGYRIGFVPDAVVHYRNRDSLSGLASQRFRYGSTQAQLFAEFRAAGAPRPSVLGGLNTWAALSIGLPSAAASAAGRGRWLGKVAYRAGRLYGGIRHGVVFL
jgi:glycosyltransferase involved in cell wall biosynthesis